MSSPVKTLSPLLLYSFGSAEIEQMSSSAARIFAGCVSKRPYSQLLNLAIFLSSI